MGLPVPGTAKIKPVKIENIVELKDDTKVKPVVQRAVNNEKLEPKQLQEFMNLHGISRIEMSQLFGVSVQAVTTWLNGKREISVTNSRLVHLFLKYPKLLREF